MSHGNTILFSSFKFNIKQQIKKQKLIHLQAKVQINKTGFIKSEILRFEYLNMLCIKPVSKHFY